MKKKSLRILALLLAGSLMLSSIGCSNKKKNTSESASGKGGQVLYLATSTTDGSSKDDKVSTPWYNWTFGTQLMYRTLFLAAQNLTDVSPDLAKSYEVSSDGLTYTIVMKDGLKWSDGQELTAKDVVFSIKTILKCSYANGIYTKAFGYIIGASDWTSGKASDLSGLTFSGNTITMKLSQAYSTMIPVLAQFAILPEHCLNSADPLDLHNNSYWKAPVTSGAYAFDELNVGNFYSMKLNSNYEGTKPKITKVVNNFVSDTTTAAQSGTADYVWSNSTDVINQLSKVKPLTCFSVDVLFYKYFICNISGVDGNKNPVMQNEKVREAIMYAIDRTALASLYPGNGSIINSGVPNTYDAYNGVAYSYDPEKAKQLLKDAGYDFNYTFRILYYNTDSTTKNLIDAVVYYLQQIGMKVESTLSNDGTTDLFKTRNYDIGFKGLSAFNISQYYGEYASNSSTFKSIFGGNTSFDSAITELSAATTTDATNTALKKLETLEQENLYKLPMLTIGTNVYINTDHVSLPANVSFGNPLYKSDCSISDWTLKG